MGWAEDAATNRDHLNRTPEGTASRSVTAADTEVARRFPLKQVWVLGKRMRESIVLASTSPQRRAILEQLRIPFEVIAPAYEETPGGDPLEHAAGKARSVDGGERPVLGVDTIVVCAGEVIGKPRDAGDAERMLELLGGRTHEVVSGLCLRTAAWEELHVETTLVSFRELTPRDLGHYLASGEWEGRAGAYAIQGLGASLVEWVEGDYLNVVGLPAGLLRAAARGAPPVAYGLPLDGKQRDACEHDHRARDPPAQRTSSPSTRRARRVVHHDRRGANGQYRRPPPRGGARAGRGRTTRMQPRRPSG